MLTRAEQKRGRNFKVTDHLPGYEELQNEILDAIVNCSHKSDYDDLPSTVWVNEVIAEVLYDASLTNFQAQKQKRDEITNEIKILANESKIRLGPYRIDGRKVPFEDRTVELSPGYRWCEDYKHWGWV